MDTEHKSPASVEKATLASAMPTALDSLYHEVWSCGHCGREFGDCTSCVTHEQQCGGHLSRW